MRIWSIHPKYLDTKGLVALWRETLLAKNVLENKTKGYKNHPQLYRFKESENPILAINCYLFHIWVESKKRNFNFDNSKFSPPSVITPQLNVTNGQIEYESSHLLQKLIIRDNNKFIELSNIKLFTPHPLFNIISGSVENWEKVQFL